MTNTPITLHDLRERIYVKAKADKTWRFWGLYVHVCKMETLLEAYVMAWKNDGAPGIDGVTFKDIEESGEQGFLEQLRSELVSGTYRPAPNRKKEIPKDKGKFRTLGIPCIRDRVVQGALKLILVTATNGKPRTPPTESAKQHTAGRPRSLTSISKRILITCVTISCCRKWQPG
jgi:RNA-directed DNA polymerase